MARHQKRWFGCVTKHKLPSQLVPVARPTLNEEIEDMGCEENEEDDVMPIVIIADILANAPFKEVWAAIIEDDENSVVTLLITYNNHPWIMISFNWLVIIWGRGIRSKVDVQSLGSRRTLDVYGGGEVLKI